MNDFWHLFYLLTLFHSTSSQISHSKYWRQLKPYDDLKPRLRTNEGIELKFKYGIAKDQVRGNTFSKWIGPNGRLSTSRALTPSEETHYIKKAGKRMVEDKQGTETVAEQRRESNNPKERSISHGLNDSKNHSTSTISSHSTFNHANVSPASRVVSQHISQYHPQSVNSIKRIPPQPQRNPSSPHNIAKAQSRYEMDLKARPSYGAESKAGLSYGVESKAETSYGVESKAGPSYGAESKAGPSYGEESKAESRNEIQSHKQTEAVEKEEQGKIPYLRNLPVPSRCPPLNPLVNSLPHDDTDKTCGQSLEGWTKDPQCACIYSVAERTDEGCPAKFYTLCYRLIDQSADYETKEFGPQVSKTSYGQNTETYSRREPIDHYDQRPVNDNKLKLNEKRGSERMEKIWLEDDKKVNQTVSVGLSAEESESKESESNESESKESKLKEDEAQSIIVNSTTQFLNMNELTRRDNETLESSEQI